VDRIHHTATAKLNVASVPRDDPSYATEGTMFWSNMRWLGGRRLWLLVGLMLALAGCGQLAYQQPTGQSTPLSQQQASVKLPPF
jgi:hypothetical protein